MCNANTRPNSTSAPSWTKLMLWLAKANLSLCDSILIHRERGPTLCLTRCDVDTSECTDNVPRRIAVRVSLSLNVSLNYHLPFRSQAKTVCIWHWPLPNPSPDGSSLGLAMARLSSPAEPPALLVPTKIPWQGMYRPVILTCTQTPAQRPMEVRPLEIWSPETMITRLGVGNHITVCHPTLAK